jgi:hypothetical protein
MQIIKRTHAQTRSDTDLGTIAKHEKNFRIIMRMDFWF